MVVLQKEQRSRRMEAGFPDVVLGAPGLDGPILNDRHEQPLGQVPEAILRDAEQVALTEIQNMEANIEPENDPNQYMDLDFEDNEGIYEVLRDMQEDPTVEDSDDDDPWLMVPPA